MHPGSIEERFEWAAALKPKLLRDHVADYRRGSTDPADVDAYYEFIRRLNFGLLKGRQGDYRCGTHQRRLGRPRKCPYCTAEYEDAKQRFPELFRKGRKSKRNNAAHDGVTGD